MNEPAFPLLSRQGNSITSYDHPGMTLRDYFATLADVTWSKAFDAAWNALDREPTVIEVLHARAKLRYLDADAMLKARDE